MLLPYREDGWPWISLLSRNSTSFAWLRTERCTTRMTEYPRGYSSQPVSVAALLQLKNQPINTSLIFWVKIFLLSSNLSTPSLNTKDKGKCHNMKTNISNMVVRQLCYTIRCAFSLNMIMMIFLRWHMEVVAMGSRLLPIKTSIFEFLTRESHGYTQFCAQSFAVVVCGWHLLQLKKNISQFHISIKTIN